MSVYIYLNFMDSVIWIKTIMCNNFFSQIHYFLTYHIYILLQPTQSDYFYFDSKVYVEVIVCNVSLRKCNYFQEVRQSFPIASISHIHDINLIVLSCSVFYLNNGNIHKNVKRMMNVKFNF